MQAARLLGAQRDADDSGGVADEERHLVGRAMGSRNEKVALVFAVIVVCYDDDLASGEGLDRGFDTLMVVRHGSTSKSVSGLERPGRPLTDLSAVHQIVIGEHARHHRLADRHRAYADTGIMAALGDDIRVLTIAIDRLAWSQDRGCRLDREPCDDGLAG